jgi:hypothetical protein
MGVGTPPPPRRRRRDGCLGCLVIILLVLVLAVAGVVVLNSAVNAGAPAPASVVIFAQTVHSKHGNAAYGPARSGEVLSAGDSLKTVDLGRAAIQFSDGSLTRLAPGTEVTVDQAQLQKSGALGQVSLTQRAGRTLSTVQRLINGGGFKVNGNSTSAEVRGTRFEVFLAPDRSVVFKLFNGRLKVTAPGGAVTLTSAQQVTVNPQGQLGTVGPLQNDSEDPFNIELAAEDGAATGTTPGTSQSSAPAANLATGASTTSTYFSGGGDLVAELGYPGSLFKLCVAQPAGAQVCAQTPSPIRVVIPNGAAGAYKVTVTALHVPAEGEPYFLTVATRSPCQSGAIEANGVVRETLSATDLVQNLKAGGVSDVSANVSAASSAGAVISGHLNMQGFGVSGTAVVYAVPPNIAVVVTAAKINGVAVPPSQALRFSKQNLSSIPLGFDVDRVYSCNDVVVIEGHHPLA